VINLHVEEVVRPSERDYGEPRGVAHDSDDADPYDCPTVDPTSKAADWGKAA
jgi:hypothetical protein